MDTLIPAIVGLVGVLVGAVITTWANFLLVVRKEMAEAEKEKLFRANKLKTAARQIGTIFSPHKQLKRNLLITSVGRRLQLVISRWMLGTKIEKHSPVNCR